MNDKEPLLKPAFGSATYPKTKSTSMRTTHLINLGSAICRVTARGQNPAASITFEVLEPSAIEDNVFLPSASIYQKVTQKELEEMISTLSLILYNIEVSSK